MINSPITAQDFNAMREDEKQAWIYQEIGFTQNQLQDLIKEFKYETGKDPNAIFLSIDRLAPFFRIGVVVRKLFTLRVIPFDGPKDEFFIKLEDPHDWGDLFYL